MDMASVKKKWEYHNEMEVVDFMEKGNYIRTTQKQMRQRKLSEREKSTSHLFSCQPFIFERLPHSNRKGSYPRGKRDNTGPKW